MNDSEEKGSIELLVWLEQERNVLQNTGSLMWTNPEGQRKALQMADHLDKALQYINLSKKSGHLPPLPVEDQLSKIVEYVDGSKIAERFKGLTIPVIEYNEAIVVLKGKVLPVEDKEEQRLIWGDVDANYINWQYQEMDFEALLKNYNITRKQLE
jgi:hypothetical protein